MIWKTFYIKHKKNTKIKQKFAKGRKYAGDQHAMRFLETTFMPLIYFPLLHSRCSFKTFKTFFCRPTERKKTFSIFTEVLEVKLTVPKKIYSKVLFLWWHGLDGDIIYRIGEILSDDAKIYLMTCCLE